ncbi:hypothetical protein L6164_025380 [Bauhinia variegata]|uniref:Uncharacterized protein n=1 Tax=Bauhinia variegata TaxID=167791 RepID=A0ACB9M0F0_BAUVA|nr:hypothetical protein L6164_025380 [Bauhinia variegata]
MDRLSSLPDELLIHILSFLDASDAFNTSFLSKRWKHLWVKLPILRFSSRSFPRDHLLVDFVQHFLLLRGDAIVTDLSFVNHRENHMRSFYFFVEGIMNYVKHRGIQSLRISADIETQAISQLFDCQSLQSLKLERILTGLQALDFIALKKLDLVCCRFNCYDKKSLDLFKGCSNLQSLTLDSCQFICGILDKLEISAPELTDLNILWMRHRGNLNGGCVIELSTPKLKTFTYGYSDLYQFSIMVDLPLMHQLHVDAFRGCGCFDRSEVGSLNTANQLVNLFKAMGNAKFVTLTARTIGVLSALPSQLDGPAPFSQLSTLKILTRRRQTSINSSQVKLIANLMTGNLEFSAVSMEYQKVSV